LETTAKSRRIPALDFTKGALVLIMVLYHWLNYFIGPQGNFYVYLRFLPPSFIFITGFLISYVYLSAYRINDRRTPRRLVVRGLKLLAVFMVLNALINLLLPDSRNGKSFLETFSPGNLMAIYITGNFRGGRLAAFTILVPISYLLIFSAFLMIATRYYKYIFHLASLLFLGTIFTLGWNGLGSRNLELLTVGLLGVSAGYIPMDKINNLLKYPYALLLAYVGYVIAISLMDVSYPLQVAGVCLTLMIIYWIGLASGDSSAISRTIILLGKYSLLGYIAQIALLQIMRRGLRHFELQPWELTISFVVAVVLTIITVQCTDRAREKLPIVNTLYTAVFA
jgi:peptidoglycan/LPS O-acetylase OafA/YrhL